MLKCLKKQSSYIVRNKTTLYKEGKRMKKSIYIIIFLKLFFLNNTLFALIDKKYLRYFYK